MPQPRQPLSSISMENMERYKRRKEGSIRSLPEIRRAVRLRLPITPGEQRVLKDALTPAEEQAEEGTRDVGGDGSSLDAPADIDQGEEVDASQKAAAAAQQKAEAGGQELHGAAKDAVEHPEDAAMELAPPGPDHEALHAHDDALKGSQQAIVTMERANGPADKLTAVTGMFDAAKEHKDVARQFDALAAHMQEHELIGAPKARAVGKAHRDAAMAIERAATTGTADDYGKAHAAARKTEGPAKELSEVLKAESVKRAAKAKKDRKTAEAQAAKEEKTAKDPELVGAQRALDHIDHTRNWAEWDAEHEVAHRNAMGAGRRAFESKSHGDLMRASRAHYAAGSAYARKAHAEFAKGNDSVGERYARVAGAHTNASIDAQMAAEAVSAHPTPGKAPAGELNRYKRSAAQIERVHSAVSEQAVA